MSRRTRASASATTSGPGQGTGQGTDTDPEADPEFMALTPRQQRSIDRAFDRATRPRSEPGPSRKRRRLETPPGDDYGAEAGGGGFMDVDFDDAGEGEGGFMDAGGFVPDDEPGGFMVDDQDEEGEGEEDEYLPQSSRDTSTRRIDTSTEEKEGRRLPLRLLPAILSSLNLPSDQDVLQVFRASASGWDDSNTQGPGPGRRRRDDDDEEGGMDLSVGVKDFRAVCAALMGPDEEPEGDDGDDGDDDLSAGESAYEEEGSSDLSEEDEYQDPTTASTSKNNGASAKHSAGKLKGKGKGEGKKIDLEEKGRIKLNSRQKEIVNELWTMIKPPPPGTTTDNQSSSHRGAGILGRDEVKKRVRELGEMWSEDEITDMVTLFSTQHQGRGLSYDDFGSIMVRAGLA